MAELLLVIFALPVTAKGRFSVGDGLSFHGWG